MMCIDYNPETMKFVYYDNGEIEIVKNKDDLAKIKWLFHFRNVWEFAEAIKTAKPELAKQLKELL
ncbi:MAG: hypothetical protein ACFFDF_17175 [Candidatus Odinarchaeota archaeon]